MTVQGGRTSLVAGTVPEHDDVLLSTERLRDVESQLRTSKVMVAFVADVELTGRRKYVDGRYVTAYVRLHDCLIPRFVPFYARCPTVVDGYCRQL